MKTQQTTISEVRLVYRIKVKASERLQIKCSKDAFDIFMENWDLDSIVLAIPHCSTFASPHKPPLKPKDFKRAAIYPALQNKLTQKRYF
jgi:hypothetical protein